ncbi:MAG: peptide chain release factor N(5)-glutamine methyltransferase [Legionellales bacterium]|nr:peptide chain release factor N(5)-glutamine methyltransferase [Legionellales bacterium]
MSNTIQILLTKLTQQFLAISTSPQLDAELLLSAACQSDRLFLYRSPEYELTALQYEMLMRLATQRSQGIPIAYLLKKQEFWSMPLMVNPQVLIPRADTEVLVETVLATLEKNQALTLLDAGTGSGAIALSLAKECKEWTVFASDKYRAAINIAKFNATQQALSNSYFLAMDWLTALALNSLDALISNPPYIAADDPHLAQLTHEPLQALVAENHGYADLITLINSAKYYLKNSAWIFLEHGYNQAQQVYELLKAAGYQHIQQQVDLQGIVRVTYGQWLG